MMIVYVAIIFVTMAVLGVFLGNHIDKLKARIERLEHEM